MENEQKQQEQEIDLIELFYKVIVHWRWFLIAIAVALTGAYIYVHITTPVYQASASVVIKDSEGSDKAINDLFNQVSPSNMAATNTQIEDELEILRSRSILLQVINELNMHTTYRIKGRTRIYGDHHPSHQRDVGESRNGYFTGGTADTNRENGRSL